MDDRSKENKVFDFYSLGIEKMQDTSAAHGSNIAELLEKAFEDISWEKESVEDDDSIKIAIIGKANVGKSTLLNALIDKERAIVSPIPGTTRDSIDEKVLFNDKTYTLIDTAGIRRKHKEKKVVEKFAYIRTEEAINRANICLFVIDAQEMLTSQEKKIAQFIEKRKKGCILVFNKWDLMENVRMEHFLKDLHESFPFLKHCPSVLISAKTKRNIEKVFPAVVKVEEALGVKIPTSHLNKFIERTMKNLLPPVIQGKRLKIYYLTQIGEFPPKFILFVNRPNLLDNSYKRYLINQFRKNFNFTGIFFSFDIKGKVRESVS